MKLWIVWRLGVYMQGIVGVFSTLELAQAAAHEAKSEERDNYHYFEYVEFVLDERKKLR